MDNQSLQETLDQALIDLKDFKARKNNPISRHIHDLHDQLVHKEANLRWLRRRDERLQELESSINQSYIKD